MRYRLTADDWADEYFDRLQRSAARIERLRTERMAPTRAVRAARAYEDKTEQLTRYLRAEHNRKDVA
ncbi:hypothetical protein K8F61_17285 [Microbacterium resistens]|uniref:Uncharacterized protein n=1 Tax=Microbacterium resistens TaxID=156977 RepID=A0ABY3RQJ5_9MICO|nr:hypothetical protein [Microbacterium resistens]UGS26358.1 hypothetical protein K8F61_17285 [Microbacterium resistens]